MISHKYKCIFIHIPRCAGTSVEGWLHGADWWQHDPKTKHLLASQAREIYAEYWDDYFKFTIVRNPFTRVLSCLKYDWYFGIRARDRRLDFLEYHRHFGVRSIVEFDYRFYTREEVTRPGQQPAKIYGNILDEPLDYVARFETLQDDMREIRKRLGVASKFSEHYERSPAVPKLADIDQATRQYIARLYARDFEAYGYDPRPADEAELATVQTAPEHIVQP